MDETCVLRDSVACSIAAAERYGAEIRERETGGDAATRNQRGGGNAAVPTWSLVGCSRIANREARFAPRISVSCSCAATSFGHFGVVQPDARRRNCGITLSDGSGDEKPPQGMCASHIPEDLNEGTARVSGETSPRLAPRPRRLRLLVSSRSSLLEYGDGDSARTRNVLGSWSLVRGTKDVLAILRAFAFFSDLSIRCGAVQPGLEAAREGQAGRVLARDGGDSGWGGGPEDQRGYRGAGQDTAADQKAGAEE